MDQLRVRLLGGFEVEGVEARALGSRKARTLVKLLALARGRLVPAATVVETLWPGEELPARPSEQVGVLVSRLRPVLGPDRLVRTGGGWSLAVDWLDIAELEARVDEAAARLAGGSSAAARAAITAALALVRGELLADEPDAMWAEGDRAVLARTVGRAQLIGAEAALAASDWSEAAALAERALDHDLYDEAALRVLMRAHAAAGRPASALAAYARVRERLSEDLGVDPAPETETLHTSILLGEARPAPVAPAVVGRAAELSALHRLFARAEAGEAILAVVEGEAGIGKTTLVSAWSGSVGPYGAVLRGRCDPQGRDLPLQPILDALEAHLRTIDPGDADAVLGDGKSVLGPLVGRFSSAADAAGPTTVPDPAAGRAMLFASLLAAVERAGGTVPAVLVVDDIHQAGTSTIEWLRFAARRGRRLLLVGTTRHDAPALEPTEILTLGPLDLGAVVELFGEDRARDLLARSGGNPLFLQELAHADPGDLPATVREAVGARVEGIGDAAVTLRAAAVLGSDIDVDLLAAVLGLPVATLLGHLESGLRGRIIEERSSVLGFRHELVREALAADTNAARRAFVHREAARVLRSRPDHDPMVVAWHARLGGDIDTAMGGLIDAAATAANRYDLVLAEELLTDAIALSDSAVARSARARVRIARLDLVGAEEDAARGLELGGGPSSMEVAGWAAYYKRDYNRALQFAEEAAERADNPGVLASCLTLGGRVLHARGHLAEADIRLTRAVELAPPAVRGLAQIFLGGLRVHQGQTEEGGHLIDRALMAGGVLSHPFATHYAHLTKGLSLGMRARPAEAWAATEVALQAARAAGEGGVRFVAAQTNLRSWLLRHMGRRAEADDHTAASLEISLGQRSVMNEMYYAARLDELEARLLAADLHGAELALGALTDVTTWEGTHAWHHRQRFRTLTAEFHLVTGDLDRAREAATAALTDAAVRGGRRYHLRAQLLQARADLKAGVAIDHDAVDRLLGGLEGCAGLELWRLTAEMASATQSDRWWRDAERRAGALVVAAGENGEVLRRYVAATFTSLGR